MTKFVICYWSKHCMLRPSLWFVTGQNAVFYDQVYNSLLVRTLCYDQVYDLLLVRTLYVMTKLMICYWSEHYVTTKFMICYRSKHCMLRTSLWNVTGQNAICYHQVYDLLLVRTLLYIMLRPSLLFVTGQNIMLRPSLWFVTGQNTVWYDQVYDLLVIRMLYVMTKFMICCWSERCMLRPSL